MTNKNRLLLLLALIMSTIAYSNSYLYTLQSFEYDYYINPAFAGLSHNQIGINAFQQWVGIQNSPRLFSVNAQGRLGKFNFYDPNMMVNKTNFFSRGRVGVGASLFTEQQGAFNITGVNFAYAYHITANTNIFSIGAIMNYSRIKLETNKLNSINNDPLLQSSRINDDYLNAGVGASYKAKNLKLGLSVLNLLPNYLDDNLGLNFYYSDQIRFNIDVEFQKKVKNIAIKPHLIFFNKYQEINYVIGSEIRYSKSLSFSAFYQSYKVVNLKLNHTFPKFYLNYGFYIPLDKESIISFGSFEIAIGKKFSVF